MREVEGVYLLDRTDYEQMGLEDLRGQNEALRMKVASMSRQVASAQAENRELSSNVSLHRSLYNVARGQVLEWEEYNERQEALLSKHRKRIRKLTAQVKALKAEVAAAKADATAVAQGT